MSRARVGTLTARCLVALLPIAAAVHAQGASPALLVLEKGARSLAIVDPDRLEIVARVAAGDDPHEVVASEDGRFAYISNYGAFATPGHTLSVVDLAAKKALPPVDLGALGAPHGLELVAGRVYFTAEGSKMIGRYDPATRQIDWALGIGQNRTHMLVVGRDLARIFTSNVNSDTITILERAKGGDVSGWTMTHVPVGKGPEGFDVSPDGKELWAANSHDGTVSVVDIGARNVRETLPLNTKFANRLKFTPDGKRVLISDLGTGDLLILDAATRRELKRISLGHGAAGLLVAADGSRAFVAVSPDDRVAVVDLGSLSVTGRVSTGKGPDGMAWAGAHGAFAADQVKTESGQVQAAPDSSPTLRVFRGIPYAEPPVGDLRWKAPQPTKSWPGVRLADRFGPRCMQRALFNDMEFRSNGMGEDCLYLNVWTPARSGKERRPVLVYFYGGGYRAGDGSEPRYDGASMAGKGIVALTVNYRLGVFGFLAHPELSREAPYRASGNYGLLDQNAALRWVQRNIAAFGGDPTRVTIAGESAGSISVSAHVASPLSRDLIAGAIMESGSLIGSMTPRPLLEAEQQGLAFAAGAGAPSIAALRAMSAEKILELTAGPDAPRFGPTTDGYLLPKEVSAILEAGEQAHVPLLGGSNSEEQSARGLLRQDEPTPENYARAVRALYGDRAEEVLKLYPGSTTDEVLDSATALAGDRFIGFSTWRFMEGHRKTGGKPVYRYDYVHPRPKFLGGYPPPPAGPGSGSAAPPPPPRGASHSAEIEYAMGNLGTNTHFEWGPADHRLSEVMQAYFANFIKTGNPNGPGLPSWPTYDSNDGFRIMRLDVESQAAAEVTRARYLLLDSLR